MEQVKSILFLKKIAYIANSFNKSSFWFKKSSWPNTWLQKNWSIEEEEEHVRIF